MSSSNEPLAQPTDLIELAVAFCDPKRALQLLSLRAAALCGRAPTALDPFGTGKSVRDTPLEFNTGHVNVHFSADRTFTIHPANVDRSAAELVIPSRLHHDEPKATPFSKLPRDAKSRNVDVLFLAAMVSVTGTAITVEASNLTWSASCVASLSGCFDGITPEAVKSATFEALQVAVELWVPNNDPALLLAFGVDALNRAPFGTIPSTGKVAKPAPKQRTKPLSLDEAMRLKAEAKAAADKLNELEAAQASKPKRSSKRASK